MSEENSILIKITEDNVTWETNLTTPDVVFWLETVKSMILDLVKSE